MRASVLYVQCVAVRIWKVKNVFDVNRTGSMKPQELLMGEVPVKRKTQFLSLLIRINEVKARSPAFSFGEISVNLIISQGPRNEQSTYHDQGFVEQGTSPFSDSRPDRLCIQFIDPA